MNGPPVPRSARGTFNSRPETYGRTTLGIPLEVWTPRAAPTVLALAGIHGDESVTTVLLSAALRLVPREHLTAAVVLAANPDGVVRGTRANLTGVDLNRNFPTGDWRAGAVAHRWAPGEPSDVELSPGAHPASEPEIVALMSLIERLDPPAIVALHAPLGCIDDPLETNLGAWLARRTRLPRRRGVGYETPGSLGTWANERSRPLVTYELPSAAPGDLVRDHAPILAELLTGGG